MTTGVLDGDVALKVASDASGRMRGASRGVV